MQQRNTKQRQAVLEVIERQGGHLTADEIHVLVRKQFPRVSLGTVYRNLRVLIAQGSVRELDFGVPFSHFEAAGDRHDHLICRVCGSITDIDIRAEQQLKTILQHTRTARGFLIEDHRLDFFGICPACQKGGKQSRQKVRRAKS